MSPPTLFNELLEMFVLISDGPFSESLMSRRNTDKFCVNLSRGGHCDYVRQVWTVVTGRDFW